MGCEMRPGVRYRDRVLIDKMQGHVVTLYLMRCLQMRNVLEFGLQSNRYLR